MNPALFEPLKQRHEELFDRLTKRLDQFREFAEERALFVKDVDDFVESIRDRTGQVDDIGDFYWMANTITAWQSILVNILGENRSYGLIEPPARLKAPKPIDVYNPLTDQELQGILNTTAYTLMEWRKAEKRRKILLEVLNYDVEPGGPLERQADWRRAEEYFALDVLKGEYDMCSQVTYAFLKTMGNAFLSDILEIKAYEICKRRTRGTFYSTEEDRDADHGEALIWFFNMLAKEPVRAFNTLSPSKCTSAAAIKIVKDFIANNFLGSDQKIDFDKPLAQERRSIKALRRSELRRWYREPGGEVDDWLYAEFYVKQFYENVTAAIDNIASALVRVQQTIQYSEQHNGHRSIVDGCEAAILLFFVQDVGLRLDAIVGKDRLRLLLARAEPATSERATSYSTGYSLAKS